MTRMVPRGIEKVMPKRTELCWKTVEEGIKSLGKVGMMS
jgi:hypothetical protein